MIDYTQWADETAYAMREYYEANRPLRWWEKRNPPGSWGCIADNLMLGLLDVALQANADRAASLRSIAAQAGDEGC